MNSSRFRIAVALILCATLAVAVADPASAFVRIARQATPSSPVVQAHWFPSELPLSSSINPTNNDKSSAVALGQVVAGAQSWQDIPTSFFTVNAHEFVGAPETPPDLEFDGQNSVFFDLAGVNFGPGVIAFVRSIIDGANGHTLDADMVFNDRDFWWSVTSPALEPAPPGQSSVDLQAVACHEWGHYFSLDHTSITGSTMIPFIQNNTSQRSLELDDRAGNSTVYPEASFLSDFGTVSGTVVSGFNGSATFGAHVEAILISAPTAANSISAISGELTLRNGFGEYQIHGLPPGDYAIRIVPLDGINTTASDPNIGGPYAGIDINFEVEFWNGAGESANGFTDLAAAFTPVTVSAGANSPGVDFITNTFAGRVIIAQYGQFENVVTFRSTGFLAMRFDPPFDSPYTIQKVTFPSFTFNGVPATFLSARLCVLNPATGLPDLAAPLFSATPFVGSPNGANNVTLNLAGTVGQTYFWLLEFPSAAIPGFPLNFPFLRQDFVSMERGHFGNSYSIPPGGATGAIAIDRNITVSMQCQLADPNEAPIVGPSNLGANEQDTKTVFSFLRPGDVRADGFPMAMNSLDHTDLIARSVFPPATYSVVGSGGAGASEISFNGPPAGTVLVSTQAVDKNGNRSLQSPVVVQLNRDADEPNGRLHEAVVLTTPVVNRPESYSPAGDQDFYQIMAKPGDVIDAAATHTTPPALDGRNDPDYVMFLYDNTGELVALSDDFSGLNPRIIFTAPPPAGNAQSKAPRKFRVHVTDFYGSLLAPTAAPRIPSPITYRLDVSVTTPVNAAAHFARGLTTDKFGFVNSGPNPANPTAKFLYNVPRNAGAVGVKVRIYDVNGRLVRTLVNRTEEPGVHAAIWDGRNDRGLVVSSGKYFARMDAGSFTEKTQVTILK